MPINIKLVQRRQGIRQVEHNFLLSLNIFAIDKEFAMFAVFVALIAAEPENSIGNELKWFEIERCCGFFWLIKMAKWLPDSGKNRSVEFAIIKGAKNILFH